MKRFVAAFVSDDLKRRVKSVRGFSLRLLQDESGPIVIQFRAGLGEEEGDTSLLVTIVRLDLHRKI